MLNFTWKHLTIKTNQQAAHMVKLYQANVKKLAAAFDTEATGLHIILDHPFLFQFGWVTAEMKGYTFAVDIEIQPILARQVIEAWHKLVKNCPIYLAHNTKFDMHMLTNIGLPYLESNLSDSMFYIRYAHDALKPAEGGPALGLKEYATQYIDGSAKTHEKLLDHEKTAIAKEINRKLAVRFKACGTPPARYKAKSYTLSVIDEMFKDPIFTAEDLPGLTKQAYKDWLAEDVPDWLREKITARVESKMIPYNKLNRDNLTRYAHFDIVWVLETWYKLNPVITARENRIGLDIENQLIIPLYEMERVGFKTKTQYLINCRDNMTAYIKTRRTVFYNLAGEEVKLGQHARIQQLLSARFGREVTSTREDVLQQLVAAIKQGTVPSISERQDADCIAFIEVLEELRTLEKWYSAYIIRFLKELKHTDRLYTTINQVGAVSGRVTSDFQQFPKNPIKTVDGIELFQPRKMIEVSGGEYDALVYLDYSQIELRFQALYTILVGHPDTNLCRAYMPFNCINEEGVLFDYQNPEHIKGWDKVWYYTENPDKIWVPTDVHGETTKVAFGITEDDPNFEHLRYAGKRTNFAKNYGAQYNKICTMFPEYTAAQCRRIDNAYYTAFPGIKQYQSYCYSRADYAFTTNLFGIRYYGVSGHKLINMLIQGSAAYYLKLKIIEVYKFTKQQQLKSRWQMQIHDELSWEHHIKDNPMIFFEFKRIMEDWTDGIVPLVAEMEVTTTDWASKKKVKKTNDLQVYLGT